MHGWRGRRTLRAIAAHTACAAFIAAASIATDTLSSARGGAIIAPLTALIPQDHSYRHLSSCARAKTVPMPAPAATALGANSGAASPRPRRSRHPRHRVPLCPRPPPHAASSNRTQAPWTRTRTWTPPPLIAATTLTSDATERKSHAATCLRLVGVRQSDDDLLPRRVLLLQQGQVVAQQASTAANLFTDSITYHV